MKVTMVYCAVGVAGFNPDRLPGDREGSWIGHGAALVGSAAQDAGHYVDLIDLRQLAGWDDFDHIITENPADVYGLSVAPVDYYSALKAVFEIKTHVPAAKIIVGGIHPSIFPDEYNFDVIDTMVTGEGEVTFPELLNDIENLPKRIQGKKPDLAHVSWADRDLFDYKRELTCSYTPDQQTPAVTMLAGRGCPYHCTYCQPAENAVFGKPYRMRPVDDVIAELIYLQSEYNYKAITFWDDTFTINEKWIYEFADAYEKSGINATIAACSRADIICRRPEMISRLAEIGLDWFIIGFESGSQRLLNMIKKGTTVEQNLKAAEICHANNIKVFATYMYGLPTETREESLATARMIDKSKAEYPSPFWFLPIKGTEIYEYCDTHDLILDKETSIARTGMFVPRIKNVDYDYILQLMTGLRSEL
jgi:anaerobic magnesium-protoporphyrin IX monomethyl ester cyclase